jgi:hypothetical protein
VTLGAITLAGVGLLFAWDLFPVSFPAGAHDFLAAFPLAMIAVSYLVYLKLDINRRALYRQGQRVHLTPTEFELLELLMRNQGTPVTHTKLLRSVWGPEYGTELDYLRSFVKTLRQKIEEDPAKPKYIVTEPWVGYRFCDPLDASGRLTANS